MLQNLLGGVQSSQQFLNMSGAQGTLQNQNLGPTQIYYQQTQPQPNTQQTLLLLQLLQNQSQNIQQQPPPMNNQIFG